MLRKLLHVTAFLSVVIIIHELGHCLAAIAAHISVKEFSIGFGPTLASFTLAGIPVKMRLLLFGGYNSLDGEAFARAPVFVRAFVVMAGMLGNIFFAFLINLKRGGPKIPKLLWGVEPSSYGLVLGSLCEPLWVWVTYPYVAWREMSAGKVNLIDAVTPVPFYSNYDKGRNWLEYFGIINTVVAGCNFLPILPLDGGRLALIGLEAAGVEKPTLMYLTACFMLCLWLLYRLVKSAFRRRTT